MSKELAEAAFCAYRFDKETIPLSSEEIETGFSAMGRESPSSSDFDWKEEDGCLVKRYYAKQHQGDDEVFFLIEAWVVIDDDRVSDIYVCDAYRNELGVRGDV